MEFKRSLLSLSVAIATLSVCGLATAGTTNLVTYTPQQIIGNNASSNSSLSRGGNAVVFESLATNLIPYSTTTPNGDGNAARDIFMRVGSRTLSRVSVNSLGQEAENSAFPWYNQPGSNVNANSSQNAHSWNPSISSDGKLIVFQSNASNLDLLTADSNTVGAATDIFLRDVSKKKTYRISGIMDAADGAITPNLLDAAGFPLTSADAPWKITTEADDVSYNPVVVGTSKSSTVAFVSNATNLMSWTTTPLPFPITNNANLYAMSLQAKQPILINAPHDNLGIPTAMGDGAINGTPALSQDGRFIVFASTDTNLGPTLTPAASGTINNVFIYDLKQFHMYQLSGATTAVGAGYQVSAEGNGNSINPSITGGGSGKNYLIAFQSRATNMDTDALLGAADAALSANSYDTFVVEFGPVNPKDASSPYEIKKSSGIASTSPAVPIRRISAQIDSVTGNATAIASQQNGTGAASNTVPVIAGTSTAYTVAFLSTADNLIADPLGIYWNIDTNGATDTYVFTSKTKLFSRANVDANGQQGNAGANNPAIAPDAKGISFDSNDSFLVPASLLGSGQTQVYLRK